MPNAPLTAFQSYIPAVPSTNFDLSAYTAPLIGDQASAGMSPYDKWLYTQNQRLQKVILPRYESTYNAPLTTPIQAAPGQDTYSSTSPAPVYQLPVGVKPAPQIPSGRLQSPLQTLRMRLSGSLSKTLLQTTQQMPQRQSSNCKKLVLTTQMLMMR